MNIGTIIGVYMGIISGVLLGSVIGLHIAEITGFTQYTAAAVLWGF